MIDPGPRCHTTAFLLTLFLLLGACARMPVTPALSPQEIERRWASHRAALEAIKQWSLEGRVAIQTEKDGWNAGLHWKQAADAYAMRVMAPLGQGSYELEGDSVGVVMRTPKNETLMAATPESLMQENLGWSLPMTGLHYWVRGIPDPASPIEAIQLDGEGRMAELRQAGWRISVLRYERAGGLELPTKLFMHNLRLKVRLVVDTWQAI
jgi:outer membrane lipoprotein LolB